jgi:hypothetical protein
VDGDLLAIVGLPRSTEPPEPKGHCPRPPGTAALSRVIYVLRFGISWETPPQILGRGADFYGDGSP